MTYDYQCSLCGHLEMDHVKRMSAPAPEHCGVAMEQRFFTPRRFQESFLGSTRMPGYHCVVADTFVSSTKQRREIMAAHNLMEKE